MLQMVRSMLSWAATDILARAKRIEPLYGHTQHYPILAVRGFTGAAAMTLYYEAFERLELSEGVRFVAHMLSCCNQDVPALCGIGSEDTLPPRRVKVLTPLVLWHVSSADIMEG